VLQIIAKWKFPLSLPRCARALPTLQFSREFGLGLFLRGLASFFSEICGLDVFAERCLFLGLCFAECHSANCFFFEFYGAFVILIYCKTQFGVSLCKFANFGLVCGICLPAFVFDFCAVFLGLFNFPALFFLVK